MDNKESQIIKECQKGDLEKFTLLYDQYIKKIYDFIYYKTYHKETAEDLTSQTFIKAFEKIKNYDHTKGGFSSWLYKIAQNTVIDHFRQQKNDLNIEDIWDLSDDNDYQIDLDMKDSLNQIRQYLQKLKPQYRNIMILRLWQQLSYKEIAEITELNEANCKMIYSRTINKLRQEMPLATFLILVLLNIKN